MPKGVYKRKPFTPEHCANLSKASRNSDAVKAHNDTMRGVPKSPEHCANISAATLGVPHTTPAQIAADNAQIGIPLSQEHCDSIKIGMENSDANKTQIESMRGGDDIVDHHYIYDESDLSLNTVQMTRSDHTRLHRLLQKLGYIVPHINQ